MKKKYPKWIDEYTRSAYQFFQGMDLRTIEPLDCFHFHPLYSELWFEHLYQAIFRFNKKQLPFVKAVNAFPNPSSIRAMIEFLVTHNNDIVLSKKIIDKQKVRGVFSFFVKVLKEKNKKDIFARRENIGHSADEIKKIVKTTKWVKGTPEASKAIGKLYLGVSSLVNGLMNDWVTDNGIEVWGPYNVSKFFGPKAILVIREFSRLKPVELWPQAKKYKHKNINIITVYKNVEMEVQFIGCHTIYKGDLAKNLLQYAVEVDGRTVSRPQAIRQLSEYYLQLARAQYKRVRRMSFEALKQKILEQELYQLKDFFKLAGLNNRPPKIIKERVKGKKLLQKRYPLETTGMSVREINHTFGIDNLKKLYTE